MLLTVKSIPPPLTREIKITESNYIKIAFGSCFGRFGLENAIFENIGLYKPNIFVWTGDFCYADTRVFPTIWKVSKLSKVYNEYNHTKNQKEYAKFENNTIIVGTWDDHDYGINNGDKYFSEKNKMKHIFLDYMAEPQNSERRLYHSGVYIDYKISQGNFSIRLILLDDRYNKDSDSETNSDILGEKQWKWLEEIFKNSKDDLLILVSGSRILPADQLPSFENWSQNSRFQLLKLIKLYKKSSVLLISGDVHFGQIYKNPYDPCGITYPLYEICSSGLTHTCDNDIKFCKFWMTHFSQGYYEDSEIFDGINFGSIEVLPNFNKENSKIYLQIRDFYGNIKIQKEIMLKSLSYKENLENLGEEMLFNRTSLHFINNLLGRKILVEYDCIVIFGIFTIFIFASFLLSLVYIILIKIIKFLLFL